ncbi:hypothetical protein BDP27DRAFT_1232571, partial [Rhodocollybia butyracea]
KVILGKEPGENTSADSKTKVFCQIALAIFPEESAQDVATIGKRVEAHWRSIIGIYRKHVKRLKATGGGVGGNDEVPQSQVLANKGPAVGAKGPDKTTPQWAVNLWGKKT